VEGGREWGKERHQYDGKMVVRPGGWGVQAEVPWTRDYKSIMEKVTRLKKEYIDNFDVLEILFRTKQLI
jgi:hypothetical protein